MTADLKARAYALRRDVLEMVYASKAGHIGGDMSVMDILVCLYFGVMRVSPETANDPDRDRFIMSKGHSVEALYAVLADRGFFPKEKLKTVSSFGSDFIGHPNNKIKGIEMNTGALGHGLPVAVGMALAARLQKRSYRTYAVLGDGELAEGSNWEAIMAAGHYKLGSLCAVVDRNRLQISGGTEQVMALENLADRFSAFNWNVITEDGNDIELLQTAFDRAKECGDRPTAIIANTVKGSGVSFMENNAQWHHRVPSQEEYKRAADELKQREKEALEG